MRADDASDQSIAVEPLTPARWGGLQALFSEGGDPKWCWSQSNVGTGLSFAS